MSLFEMMKVPLRLGCMSGEENRGIIDKAKWRIRFIDTKQRLDGNYGREQKKVERLKQRLVVRFSTDLLNWARHNLSELRKIEQHKG